MNRLLDSLKRIRLPSLGTIKYHARKLSLRQVILWGVALAVAIGVLLLTRSLTTCWSITPLPGISPASCAGGGLNPLGTPVVGAEATGIAGLPPTPDLAPPEIQYPTWDGGSRVNLVFFGLRGGETAGEDCPLCTDTIIVFTIDPVSKTAGMISVPRDLWTNIPGSSGCSGINDGLCRINTAWTTGEALKLPGGGPALAMKTVSLFLGVPIQYYVQVDFDTFVEMIRLVGGIDVYVYRDYKLKRLGGGKDVIKITCCGMRHLTGAAALAYARCRSVSQGCDDGDVGRAHRQQQVILAIRDRVLDPKRFPELMAQAPGLYNTLQAGIRTNIPLEDGLKLASLVSEVPLDQIQQGVVDDHMVNYGNVLAGGQDAAVLLPIPDKIRELRDRIFTAGGPTSPIAQGDPGALMRADGARVYVTNNTYTASLEQRTANFLLSQGMQVIGLGAPTGVSNTTVVVLYSAKLYTLRYLINPLGMIASSNQIQFKPDANSPVDVEIRLGNDWVSRLPAGF
jgi:LCP family protein required for cell wall assembly